MTRQTRQMPSDGMLSSPGTDHRSRPDQIARSEMQHLSRASLQSAAHRQHLASHVGAHQETTLPQTTAECLLAHRQALASGAVLGIGSAPF